MADTTVRIEREDRSVLRELAESERASMQQVLHKAIEMYRRKRILAETNAAYAALRKNPKAWKAELKERKVWERALKDGLDE